MNEKNDTDGEGRRPVLIMGIGNLVLQDEGFGVHAVQRLARRELPHPDIDLLDGGTAGLHLMGYLRSYDRVVVIDAALDNNPPGTVRRLRPSYQEFPPLVTAHEIGLKDVIEAMQLTGFCPEVELIVVSATHYDSLGCDLSPEVEAAVEPAITLALEAAMESFTDR